MAVNSPILLLGANGQLGYESRRSLAALGSVEAFDIPEIDFGKPDSLRDLVRRLRPRIIVNAAAYTAVDKAEEFKDLAFSVNAAAPGILAEEAEAIGAVLVHYSTDYVFDGRKTSPYVESDTVNPLSVYGKTKQQGEVAVAAAKRHLTFRTSWVVGVHGANFIKTMLRLGRERDTLRVVADQVGAPTTAPLLADVTVAVLRQMADQPAGDPRWGLYHLTSRGETSWHGFTKHILSRAAAKGVALKVDPQAVEPITTADYPTPATRPGNSRLDTSKLRETFALTLPEWQAAVDPVIDGIISEVAK